MIASRLSAAVQFGSVAAPRAEVPPPIASADSRPTTDTVPITALILESIFILLPFRPNCLLRRRNYSESIAKKRA